MALYSERNGLPTNKVKTEIIQTDIYLFILECCDKYLKYLACSFPLKYRHSSRIWGLDEYRFHAEIKYRIPIFYEDNYRLTRSSYKRFKTKYNQYALFDYIEFIAQNIRTISNIQEYDSGAISYEFQEVDDGKVVQSFRDEINGIFNLGGVVYTITENNIIERITSLDEQIKTEQSNLKEIKEQGLKSLLIESIELYKKPRPEMHKLATEKIWDAFERLKTIFGTEGLSKKQSVERLIGIMTHEDVNYIELINTEFDALTKIGNNYRIRHHEIDKIEISDDRYYDYLYNRCFTLIALAVKYI